MDAEVTRWINSFAGIDPFADQAFTAITHFGVPAIVAFVALQWWSVNDRTHVRHAAICAGLAFLLGLAINQAILLFVHRIRPYDAGVSHLLVAQSADWSFPSDHATASIAVAAAFLLKSLPRRTMVLFAMAVFVCISRIYVGMHYVTDIVGGAATGVAAAIIIQFSYREGNRIDRIATRIL
jgi:undecaprenyl-diphosphatase